MDNTLILCSISLIAAGIALWRCYVPPQGRDLMQLRQRVELVEEDNAALHERLNKRALRENMGKAREGATAARIEKSSLLEQAERIAAQGQQPAQPRLVPTDPEELRRHLRAEHLGR